MGRVDMPKKPVVVVKIKKVPATVAAGGEQ